jgi:PleD family two-component response regulator
MAVRAILEKSGFSVIEIETGEQALEYCREYIVDLVLLDAWLPGMSGVSCCQVLRALFPELPIVMITALEDPNLIQEMLAAGATDYIPKPIEWNTFSHRLSRLVMSVDRPESW